MAGASSSVTNREISGGTPRKALFRSPVQNDSNSTLEALEALLNKIQVDIEVDSNLKGLKKDGELCLGVHLSMMEECKSQTEIHEQSLTTLRQELNQLSQDEWMYKPIDQIIGF